ncbi:hypothetical protein EXIGLDRAFT_779772, partial [Exidia glandulosa HHB12029]
QQWRERQTFRKQPAPAARTAPARNVPAPAARTTPVPASMPTPVAPRREPDVKPMDVDRNRARFHTDGRVRGACYACGEVGHYAGDARCPHVARLVAAAVAEAIRKLNLGAAAQAPGKPR